MRDMTEFEISIYVAIGEQFTHFSGRFPLDQFAHIIGQCASYIEPVLKDEYFIQVLAQAGTLLWFEGNNVCVVDSKWMKFRQPCGPYVCRHCLIDSHGEMLKDPDPKSRNGKVHPQCMPRYMRLLQSVQLTEARQHAYRH